MVSDKEPSYLHPNADLDSRQCAGQLASSCTMFNVENGCADRDAYALDRETVRVNVTCPSQGGKVRRSYFPSALEQLFSPEDGDLGMVWK